MRPMQPSFGLHRRFESFRGQAVHVLMTADARIRFAAIDINM